MDSTTIGLLVALIVAIIGIIAMAVKLSPVVGKAEKRLPPTASEQQKLSAAINAILTYLQANPQVDKQLLQDIITIIEIIGEIAGIDVSAYVSPLKKLLTSSPP